MALPTEPTVNTAATMTPDRLRAIVYGKPGAGKTTLAASWFPRTNLIIDLEGGTRFLPGAHFIERPENYDQFAAIIRSLTSESHQFTTVVIDTVDRLHRLADNAAGKRYGKVAAGLADYGKGLEDRDATIVRDLSALLATDLGVILVGHPVQVSEEPTPGTKVERLYPRIDPKDRIRQEVMGAFDYILHVRKSDHMLQTGGDPLVETKRRVLLPDTLPADAGALFAAVQAGTEAVAGATTKTTDKKELTHA